jgi:hypothetical protein
MMLVVSALHGFSIEASDGAIGTVSDFLFDDRSWKLRWMVVDTGNWLPGRKVLIHPRAIGHIAYERQELAVALTKEKVKNSPDLMQDQPVSMQIENDLYGYYGWDPVWGGSYFGMDPMTMPIAPPAQMTLAEREMAETLARMHNGDPHLRSTKALTGCHLHATDGEIGHLENFLIDKESWAIRYLIVDTRNWWFGRHVLLSPYAVREIDGAENLINLDVTKDRIEHSPVWDPAAIVELAYEKQLHSYYDWPGYGW